VSLRWDSHVEDGFLCDSCSDKLLELAQTRAIFNAPPSAARLRVVVENADDWNPALW